MSESGSKKGTKRKDAPAAVAGEAASSADSAKKRARDDTSVKKQDDSEYTTVKHSASAAAAAAAGFIKDEPFASAPAAAALPLHDLRRLPNDAEIALICKQRLPANLPTVNKSTLQDRRVAAVVLVVNDSEWCTALTFFEVMSQYHLATQHNLAIYFVRFHGTKQQVLLVRLQSRGGSSGGDGAQLVTTAVLTEFSPRFVVTIGCAGAWNPDKQKFGDVLVSTVIAPYSYVKGQEDRNKPQVVNPMLCTMVHNVVHGKMWDCEKVAATPETEASVSIVHEGVIFSGDELVVSLDQIKKLSKQIDGTHKIFQQEVVGAEMEGTGIWTACSTEFVPSMIIKGVSDSCVGKSDQTDAEKQRYQTRASYAAFDFFRFAFRRAAEAKSLPHYWTRPARRDNDDTIVVPEAVKEEDILHKSLATFIRFMQQYKDKLVEARSKEPANIEEIKAEHKELVDRIKKDEERKRQLWGIIQGKLDAAVEAEKNAQMNTLDAEWGDRSNQLKVEVDGTAYSLKREHILSRVKWSATAVAKYVQPAIFHQMQWDLRDESKVTIHLFDSNNREIPPKKLPKKTASKNRKSRQPAEEADEDEEEMETKDAGMGEE